MSQEMESKLFLELGQIIKISAPTNLVLHENTYLIDYLDDNLIKLLNDKDFTEIQLTIKGKKLTDESIEQISVLANPEEKGYARQNGLIKDEWVSIEFGGDVPIFINGQITDLEEDSIEITTYETKKKLYIDFGYKGIPLDLPIINIKSFYPPDLQEHAQDAEQKLLTPLEDEDDYDDSDEDLDLILDSETIEKNTEELFIEIDDIELVDEDVGEITEMIQVDEENKRFGIETQTQDILDELLAEYPTNQRTESVLNKIHIIIERYKQLRREFSTFDEMGNAENIKVKGANYKPLIERMKKLDRKLHWLIPVARNSHKLFDAVIRQDEFYEDAQIGQFKYDTQEVMEYFNNYKTNSVPDSQNKYTYLFQGLNSYFTPFLETNNNDNIIIKKQVNENLDILINNSDNFTSSMIKARQNKDAIINDEQFVIDRYNLGLNKLHNPDIKNKHSKNVIVPLTNNDTVNLLGFITLPLPYIQYSCINLPTTSIYKKVNLHNFNYFLFQILNMSKKMNETLIKEGEEFDNTKPINKDLFKHKMYYNFEERRNYVDRDEGDYNNFLDIMIPQTKTFFNILKQHIKNPISFIKIIEYLEPFLIYSNDISYKLYEEIRDFIYDEITEYKKKIYKYNQDRIKFIRSVKDYQIPTIMKKLVKRDYLDIFEKKFYNIKDDDETELSLRKIIDYDNGMLYNTALSLSELTFGQPIAIEEKIQEELKQTEMNIEGKKDSDESCNKLTLVKRYQDFDELTEDNNSPTFVDKKYDETPYDIGNDWISKYSDEYENAEDMKVGLRDFLIVNNGIEDRKAKRDAEAMIDKSRLVYEGEYAILDRGDSDIKYYIRQNNIWKYDKNLSGKNIDEINFCNIKSNCLKIKETCTNLDTGKEMLKKNILEDIVNRFDEEMKLGLEELKTNLLTEFNYRKQNITSLKKLKVNKLIKKDLLQLKIANSLEEQEIIVSPYESLRDAVLSQSDIIKKFANILIFINQYCRIADGNEDNNWFYCIDTNIKLLPTFFYELAEGFQKKQYVDVLQKIYKDRGTLSDDGDKWVDKYSGYYISNIMLDTTEGYDKSGYKIKSREIMQETMGDKLKSNIKDVKLQYSTKLAKELEKMIKTFDEKLYISTESQHNFIIKITIQCINQYVPDELSYKSIYAKKIKEGKKLKTYEKKYDEILFYSLISAYMVAVQSVIPGVISTKAFGNCKKSFVGFPIDGNSDFSFIEYFSCMLFHLKRGDRPWNIIPKALSGKKNRKKNYSDIMEKFVTKIKNYMDEKILIIDEVNVLLNLKREWNKRNIDYKIVSDEFDVQKWTEFLPPLVPVNVKSINNIAGTFENTLRSRMKEGSYEQFKHLFALYGKIKSYSFSIIQSIQRVIDKEPLLLETKNGIPFLENACCNNGEPKTNLYFSEKESSIQKHNNIIEKLAQIYYRYKNSHKSPFFNILKNTKILYTPISRDFSKTTIYLAFIKFCKFNTGIELDENLKRLCINNSCNFNKFDPIKEKIIAMENDDLNYNKESLNILLNIINRQNILKYDLDPPITTEKNKLESTLNYLLSKDKLTICDRTLLEKLNELVDRFDISVTDKNDIVINEFKVYLNQITNTMVQNILEKLNITRNNIDVLKLFQPTGDVSYKVKNQKRGRFILNWKGYNSWMISDSIKEKNDNYISKKDEMGLTVFNMIKELVVLLCKVYPTIILNKIDYNDRYIPKHWLKGSKKFSEMHAKDIKSFMLKDGVEFSKFYGDERIAVVLDYVLKNNEDILMLLNSIPFYADIDNNITDSQDSKSKKQTKKCSSIFDGEIVKKLGYYFLLCSFNIYISAFDNDLNIPEKEDDEIYRSAKFKMKQSINELLNVYIEKIKKYKKTLDVTPEEINKNVLKSKTKEKEKMVKRLGDLTVEEREIEDLMKSYSLGNWGLGKTKAVYEYDENQYDKERQKMEEDALLEMKTGGLDDVSEFNRELYNISDIIDTRENDDVANRINAEINDLSFLPEDDDFGDMDGHGGSY